MATETVRAAATTVTARAADTTAAARAEAMATETVRAAATTVTARAADTIAAARAEATATETVRAADTTAVARADFPEDLLLVIMQVVAAREDRDVRAEMILQIRRSRMLRSTEMRKREESGRRRTSVPEKILPMKRMSPRCREARESADSSNLRLRRL